MQDNYVIKLGIVGCGDISNVHGNGVLKTKGVQFAACCDLNGERAEKWAETYGCEGTTPII